MKQIILLLFRFYQKGISPLKPPSCRFYPTCSHYGMEAVQKHGTRHGLFLTVRRVFKCGPWHPGGYDPVPELLIHHDVVGKKEGKSTCSKK